MTPIGYGIKNTFGTFVCSAEYIFPVLFFRKLGAKNELLTPVKLKQKFPWINTDGIALGCHGLENEGW
jgi:hypothetical protein